MASKCFNDTLVLYFLLISLLLSLSVDAVAQSSIIGPSCVVAGSTCSYTVRVRSKEKSALRVCLTGGRNLLNQTCFELPGDGLSFQVIWDESGKNRMEIKSIEGAMALQVEVAKTLHGGLLSNKERLKESKKGSVSYNVNCDEASGGTCKPEYEYQWQVSDNQLKWTDLSGETGKNLRYAGEIKTDLYFRRKVTERRTGQVAYSEMAILFAVL